MKAQHYLRLAALAAVLIVVGTLLTLSSIPPSRQVVVPTLMQLPTQASTEPPTNVAAAPTVPPTKPPTAIPTETAMPSATLTATDAPPTDTPSTETTTWTPSATLTQIASAAQPASATWTVLPTQPFTASPANPTSPTNTGNPTPIDASIPAASTPRAEPVLDQVVITFAPEASAEQREAYVTAIGGTVVERIDPLNSVVVQLSPDAEAADPNTLPRVPIVITSEPDYYVTAQSVSASVSEPNDPLYPAQWALSAIGAPAAWAALPADLPPVAIAVIDSGICADHSDLQGRILPGWDFVDGDDVPQDDFGHGCGVSGILAANYDNAQGIVGIAPNARVMPLRVLNAQGVGLYSDVAAALVYAADHGAQLINLSLGGAFPSTLLQEAVDYAISKGVRVVAAAGNTGGSVLYPAAYAPVIAVGAVTSDLQPALFSSHGPEIDVWAPGDNVLTTELYGGYTTMTGTSFATPYVTGALALNPSLTFSAELLSLTVSIAPAPPAETATVEFTPSPTADSGQPVTVPELDEAVAAAVAQHRALPGQTFAYQILGQTVDTASGSAVFYAAPSDLTTGERLPGRVDTLVAVREADGHWEVSIPGDADYGQLFARLSPSIAENIHPEAFEPLGDPNLVSRLALDDYRLPWTHGIMATVTRSYNAHGVGQIDFVIASNNVNVVAAKSGTIIYVNDSHHINSYETGAWWYWNTVVIRHSANEYSTYAHLYPNSVPQWIKNGCTSDYTRANCNVPITAGEVIGVQGNTGMSTGNHLHLDTGQSFIVSNYADSMDEDGDGNTTERIYTGYSLNRQNIGFVGYPSATVAAWPYGTRLQAVHVAASNLIQNGSFSAGMASWATWGEIAYRVNSGVFEFYRAAETPGVSTSAVLLQNTGVPLAANETLFVQLSLGNPSSVRKRAVLILHDADWSDLKVCSFWVAPGATLRTYQMRADTTEAWTAAHLSLYAGTADNTGWLRVDDVSMQRQPGVIVNDTLCIDPSSPVVDPGANNVNVIVNGGFSSALANWSTWGELTYRLNAGTFEFYRTSGPGPSGVVLQNTSAVMPANGILEAQFQLGNFSPVRKRVTVLLHASDWSDLQVCSFWLAPNTPMQTYVMRTYATMAWPGATISFYPTPGDNIGWLRLDNVSMQRRAGITLQGTECYEPGSTPAALALSLPEIAPTLTPLATLSATMTETVTATLSATLTATETTTAEMTASVEATATETPISMPTLELPTTTPSLTAPSMTEPLTAEPPTAFPTETPIPTLAFTDTPAPPAPPPATLAPTEIPTQTPPQPPTEPPPASNPVPVPETEAP